MQTMQMTIFDGIALTAADQLRLGKQAQEIFALMCDAEWRTLHEIREATGHPTTSISAQLRNFRKDRFGAHTVNRRRRPSNPEGGTYEYQLITNKIVNHEAYG
jgi:hypothetical protein